MPTVNVYDAKNHLSKLINDALSGQDVVIAKNGKPLVRLQPIDALSPRPLGLLEGIFEVPDNFDDPLPPDVLEGFNG